MYYDWGFEFRNNDSKYINLVLQLLNYGKI